MSAADSATWAGIRVSLGHHPEREAVGGEEHRHPTPVAGRQRGQAGCGPVGQQPGEPVGPVPRRHRGQPEGRIGRGRCGLGPPEVLTRAQGDWWGVSTMPTTRATPPPARAAMPVFDGGRGVLGPVAHHEPTGVGRLEGGRQPVHLGPGSVGQRRGATDGPVPADQLVEELGGRRSAPPDGGVEGLDPFGGGRGAVGHDQHADRRGVPGGHRRPPSAGDRGPADAHDGASTPARPSACTSSTTCSKMPGSVSGNTPCPRLKT